jgi:hypothetical protein
MRGHVRRLSRVLADAGRNDNNTTPLQGIARYVPALAYARGTGGSRVDNTSSAGFPAAVAAAKKARVTIAIMGLDQTQ